MGSKTPRVVTLREAEDEGGESGRGMCRTEQTVNGVARREEMGKKGQRGVRWEETPTVVGRGRQGETYRKVNEPETEMGGYMRQGKERDGRMT